MLTQAIGWTSSAILFFTIATQVHKQWSEGTSRGVSRWLFVGQAIASFGFTVYSALVGDAVFIATNGLLFATALFGLGVVIKHTGGLRRRR